MNKYCMNRKQQKVQEVLDQPAKRVNIVSLRLVREGSVLYKERHVKSPEDAYKLLKMQIGRSLSSFVWTRKISRRRLTFAISEV